ncbi:MAG: hypothetical protein EXQ53_10470, partial [Acidobacteria bacterium]|nr:hypothetical protein [Acidobacteriota bacterium]
MLRRVMVIALLAGVASAWYALLPPRARALPTAAGGLSTPVRGAFHVHSRRSDGTADVEEIAAAAARADLGFLILTDHGDGTRKPDPPAYRAGVLCIDAVEISTSQGHVVALGLPQAPYPLAGDARDVVEDIARLGGFAMAAHPGSAKPELQWSDWSVPLGGLEWLNADSEWRDESAWSLARALFTYPIRKTDTLVALLDRPAATMRHWDELTTRRRVVAMAGADAHARLGVRSLGEPYDNGSSLHVPSYEEMFRVFSSALPNTTFGGDASADAQAVLDAIRSGHVYSAIDALGGPVAMSFTATSGAATAAAGDVLPLGGPVTLRIHVQGPDTARIELVKNGDLVQTATGTALEQLVDEAAAVYRAEIVLPGGPGEPPVPWIVSNPIYVGRSATDVRTSDVRPRASRFAPRYGNGPATGWTIETSAASLGALNVVGAVGGTQLSFRYALGGTASSSPFTAFVMPAGSDLADYDRVMFTARADGPMRLSVQLREPVQEAGGEAGERWHRSVYLDATPRTVTVYLDDMTPRGVTSRRRPTLPNVQSILFVV